MTAVSEPLLAAPPTVATNQGELEIGRLLLQLRQAPGEKPSGGEQEHMLHYHKVSPDYLPLIAFA